MMHREQSDTISSDASHCTVRRFAGPEADEFFILCWPEPTAADSIAGQTESVYRMLHDALRAEGGGLKHVVHEAIFFRNIGDDLGAFQAAQSEVFDELSCNSGRPASTCIQQPPLNERQRLGISAFAVIPRQPRSPLGRTLWNPPPCACAARVPSATRVIGVGSQELLYAGNIYGADGHAFEEAYSMLGMAGEVLRKEGLTFRHVIRTWIHLRDIDRDYAEFNRARREFFDRTGVTLRPASTGIGGASFPERHNFSMSLYAIKSSEPLDVALMSTPTLNEAWMYGSDFSRGLKVVEANKVALYISGTASVDEEGRTVHEGDFEGQVHRMITNVSTLLAAHDASMRDLVSAITYVKSSHDAPLLRQIFHAQGMEGFPNAIVTASVCRPNLLCEMEAIAALPRPAKGTPRASVTNAG